MAKNKLTGNQIRRIKYRKDKIVENCYNFELDQNVDTFKGVVVSRYGKSVDILANNGSIIKCFIHRTNKDLAVGDKVIYQIQLNNTGVVISKEDRTSVITRPDIYGGIKIIAANIDQVIIVSSIIPSFSTNIIDRYLVAASTHNISAIILLNKSDLILDKNKIEINRIINVYRNLGYEIYLNTVLDIKNTKNLIYKITKEKTSILVGQSGVGKSSIINCLDPIIKAKTNEISNKSNLGQHTTTKSTYYKLDTGAIIDSPGIREFGIYNLTPKDIINSYKEIYDIQHNCRFRNCNHISDEGCSVIKEMNSGNIEEFRYNNFKSLINEIKNNHKSNK